MRILIIADEVWNDEVHGNNVLSNWFSGFDAEFAHIYGSPGSPKNNSCTNYFQVTDIMMAKSILGKPAGRAFKISVSDMQQENGSVAEAKPEKFYQIMKSMTGEGLRTVREMIWQAGKYDTVALKKFVTDFNPDIVFCPRLLTPKVLRLEKIVSTMTKAPFVAFTADDEASLMQVSYSPLFWIKRHLFRKQFKKHIGLYKHYYTFSEEQANEYHRLYNVPASTLYKGGNFNTEFKPKQVHEPIRMVYAGRFYCSRWKTLGQISKAIKNINSAGVRIIMDVYTPDTVTDEQRSAICLSEDVQIKGRVTPAELREIYAVSDIALHVESFEKKYKYATRVSFSTKIVDLMASSCAIMAICWHQHAGYQYLKKNDAAFCIPATDEIEPVLRRIAHNPVVIEEYAKKAWKCGKKHHSTKEIQAQIMEKFTSVIEDSKILSMKSTL
ncbi:glycosyltransferase [Chryseobacterium sp.]|uniref:glycosyltransferase family protein n=1 Tax=Chryseobacterium sp. TaxID=1871047 RepID=UPI0012AA15D7|nr:glycosyltransferase [Chryseobacterium sp.]QFG53737.1 glycosyltransferase [Chryseobacterium sp.]